MNVTANEYTADIERIQLIQVEKMIASIRDFIADDKIEVVVDIGCGSGKITSLMDEAFDCRRVIGIDIDESMIDYANANHQHCDRIEFLTQNIDCEWNDLRPEVKALEGKVSLVFTNYVLHWIQTKENTVKNIFRLLASGGKFFARVIIVPDPLKGVDSTKQEEMRNFLKIAPKEQQFQDWLNLLSDYGLPAVNSDLVEVCHTIPEDAYHNTFLKLALKLLSTYVVANNETERKQFLSEYWDDIVSGHNRINAQSFVDEITGHRMVNYYGHEFITFAIK